MDFALKEKRVLITGASKGIGVALAHGFLKEGAKACIVSRGSEHLYNTKAKLVEMFGEESLIAQECDCTDRDSLILLKGRIEKIWGVVDVVVANVGDGRSVSEPLPDEDQWKKTWDANFESSLQTARVFLPMLQKSKGCLLFISSIAAMEAFGAPVDYSTAKAAVTALAKNMARKLGGEVRVNVLAPGNVWFSGGVWDEKIKQNPERVKKMIESTVPMNRFGTTDEMADAAVFLCSERASFITGSVLVVDGGQTVGVF
jgi:3-oxoacyl-[acyl-carrier protein] reductase